MFLINSRLGLVSATPSSFGREVLHPTGAILLPKLRIHFAEFLNQSFLARLSILYLSTCVGLGYGYPRNSLEAFLDSMGWVASPESGSASYLDLCEPRICLELGLRTYPGSTIARVHLPFCVTPLLTYHTLGR